MPVLSNPQHELFCQEKAKGATSIAAYMAAGYTSKNYASQGMAAKRLLARPEVRARIDELLAGGAEKAEVTIAEWLLELKRIGFSDIRNVVGWKKGRVTLKDADDLTPEHAATIGEISESDKGALKVKLHSKVDALEKIGRYLGVYKDRFEHSGPGGGPIVISDADAARRIAFLLAKGLNAS